MYTEIQNKGCILQTRIRQALLELNVRCVGVVPLPLLTFIGIEKVNFSPTKAPK